MRPGGEVQRIAREVGLLTGEFAQGAGHGAVPAELQDAVGAMTWRQDSLGSVERLKEAIRLAQEDWRDLLMAAEFGNPESDETRFPRSPL